MNHIFDFIKPSDQVRFEEASAIIFAAQKELKTIRELNAYTGRIGSKSFLK